MNQSLKNKLRRYYRRRLEATLTSVPCGMSEEELKSEVDKLETYRKLLAFAEAHWAGDATLALACAIICLTAVAFLWSHKVVNTLVTLAAQTETVQGELTARLQLRELRSHSAYIEQVNRIEAGNLGLSIESEAGDGWLQIEGGDIALQSLELQEHTLFQLSSNADGLNIFVSRKPLRGKITVAGKGMIRAGSRSDVRSLERKFDRPIAETVEFVVNAPEQVASRISFRGVKRWNFGTIPFGGLDFATPTARGTSETEFVSGLRSGSIRLDDTARPPYSFSENEFATIFGSGRAEIQLRSADNLINVTMHGPAKEIFIGKGELKKQLAPSYLEYLYNQKTLAFFWGAAVFAWGILWGTRKTLFR